ncbi:hypothetical protein [Andreprevotia chitinilytica]|uniref:hypothetical protein n=1 Tax=Andreprevotia chitinilytica TaxID=396808 RepID=UPI00068C87B5|nr:hypothetical protein [Andreprevotia chitinilytica]
MAKHGLMTLIGAAVLAVASLQAGVAQARVDVDLNIGIPLGPPPPRVEYVPAPRVGYYWEPGVWVRVGPDWRWHNGYWREDYRETEYRPYWHDHERDRGWGDHDRWHRGWGDQDRHDHDWHEHGHHWHD